MSSIVGSALGLASLDAVAGAAVVERVIDPLSARWWATSTLLLVVILISYGAASLPKWAKWVDGTRLDRFTIVQGVFASILAGFIAWALFYHYWNQAEALCWVMAVVASYFGEQFLRWVFDRFTGKFNADQAGGR